MNRRSGSGRLSTGPLRIKNDGLGSSRRSGGAPKLSTGRSPFSRPSSSASGSNRQSLGIANRKSLAKPGKVYGKKVSLGFSGTTSRRSSGYGRYAHESMKDPRPVSQKSYKERSINQLVEFLTKSGYNYPLTPKMLHAPQTKDFSRIFQFLYQFSIPNYEIGKKIEDEVPKAMKLVGYPFTISKSSMFTVGSLHTWPSVLAALTWLREQLEYVMQIDIDRVMFPPNSEEDFDSEPEIKILYEFCTKTYMEFMAGIDDFVEAEEELERQLKQHGLAGSLEQHTEENRRLTKRISVLKEQKSRIPSLKDMINALECDLTKVTNYETELEEFEQKLSSNEQDLDKEIDDLEAELLNQMKLNESQQAIFEQQTLSQTDVERIHLGTKQLQSEVSAVEEENAGLDKEIWTREMAISKAKEVIESKRSEYNNQGRLMQLIPSTAEHAQGYDIEIERSMVHSFEMNAKFKHQTKPGLVVLKTSWTDKVHDVQERKINEQERQDQMTEMVNEAEQELSMLQAKHKRIEEELDSDKENLSRESQRLQADCERLHDELIAYRQQPTVSVHQAQQNLEEHRLRFSQRNETRKMQLEERIDFCHKATCMIVDSRIAIQAHLEALKNMTQNLYEDGLKEMEQEKIKDNKQ